MPESKVDLEEVARGLLNAPYLWGGKTFYGIDCSGLVQVVYKTAGIFLPRNASQQMETGQVVSFVEEAKSGDLAFFDNEAGEIVHVGICLGQGRILHASGAVRIDALDHQGIYNAETRKYSHHLRVIKRVI
jgi:cell wall-associated NlpC family hydrolase